MRAVHIPEQIFERASQAARAHRVSVEQFVAEAVQLYLQDEPDNYDHLFTPEVIEELDGIVAGLDAGGKTYTSAEVDAHFAAKRKAWLASHPG